MKPFMIAASAVAALALSPFAAFGEEAIGAIQSIDIQAHTLTLADGTTFVVPETVDLTALQVGMNVKVEYAADANGQLAAMAVQAAPQQQ